MADHNRMTHRFDIVRMLESAIGYKGTFYPGIHIHTLRYDKQGYPGFVSTYDNVPQSDTLADKTALGTQIRKTDAAGRWYFMPVLIKAGGKVIELPNAVISCTARKTIVSTALVGAKGSVNELISQDDYEIAIAAVVVGNDGNYPETELQTLRELWRLDESVELISAVTDIMIGQPTRIVLKSIDIPETGAYENQQVVKFTALTDSDFELIIDSDAGTM